MFKITRQVGRTAWKRLQAEVAYNGARLAQSVEHGTLKLGNGGSCPTLGAIVSDFHLTSLPHRPAYLKMLEETKHDQKLP
ncbi:hypothetical protein TNCV_3164941 [Trichonephila clavipes]|nr:hypothetical protein TNCV_3164941 [Trichonephila clavipes]